MLLRPLALASLMGLSACVTVTEVPPRIPVLKLMPENGLPGDYCLLRTSGATNVLDITFRNAGTADYEGGDTLTVAFRTGRSTSAVSRGIIPAIERGHMETLSVPVPPACFDPDCDFTIAWANQPEVEGFCPG